MFEVSFIVIIALLLTSSPHLTSRPDDEAEESRGNRERVTDDGLGLRLGVVARSREEALN